MTTHTLQFVNTSAPVLAELTKKPFVYTSRERAALGKKILEAKYKTRIRVISGGNK